MTVLRRVPLAVLVACVLALVAGLAGCGGSGSGSGDRKGLLTPQEAKRLDRVLAKIDRRTAEGRCQAAKENLDAYVRYVAALPSARAQALVDRLREGATNLERTIASECVDTTSTGTTTGTTTDVAPTTTTTQSVPTTTQTTTTSTTPTTTTTTPTTTDGGGTATTGTTTTQQPPSSGGGAQAPGASGSGG